MPSSNRPPEEHARVKPFDPLVLDRTLIALPLLKEMQQHQRPIARILPRRFEIRFDMNLEHRPASHVLGDGTANSYD